MKEVIATLALSTLLAKKAGGEQYTKSSKQFQSEGCTCEGDVEYVFNAEENTWVSEHRVILLEFSRCARKTLTLCLS